MPNSLCESIRREIEHKRWLSPPSFQVYMCVWLSGSTVETPNGWPRGNNAIHEPFIGSGYRDIGRFYIRTLKHAHTRARARAPTRPREHNKSGERKGRSRPSDLPILQRWQPLFSSTTGAGESSIAACGVRGYWIVHCVWLLIAR